MTKPKEANVYSAREAYTFLSDKFSSEAAFRKYLREDMEGKNIFNAKIYMTDTLSRFVIRGEDLVKAIAILNA